MTPTINLAVSVPINPPGSDQILNSSQVWAALQRKVRHPHEFVPAITSCKVVKDENNVVTRVVSFKDGPSGVNEVCTEYKPSRVEFVMEDGTKVQNVVSFGITADGKVDKEHMILTYEFEWKAPAGVKPGSPEWTELEAHYQKTATLGLANSVKIIRGMVHDGRV
ncbi:hypothetical protein BGZ83_008788 [Gryganskiella cystojenkinii]|nr:hypothetical protein BGZ83_008788 [Gryganskiella cystojenkinii]